jgi:hypothetical protein
MLSVCQSVRPGIDTLPGKDAKMANAPTMSRFGDIAQLVERTDRTREVRGSNPLISKFLDSCLAGAGCFCDVYRHVYKHKMSSRLPFWADNGKMSHLRAISSGG